MEKSGLTILVPAYNEEASIADTIRSLQSQTQPADEIIVIDDHSSDRTGEVARQFGVKVLRPPENTGSKAGAQNFALSQVTTPYTMAIDADTTLAPDAVERIMQAVREPGVAAACGFVLPRHVRTIWERGRYVEYLFAFTFYKPIQDYIGKPLIASGCFSAYRTDILREQGGWSRRTMAEDMDLTWSFYRAGYNVRFVPKAVSYPIEPHNFEFMSKQLRRWSHGFAQNVRLHWRDLLDVPILGTIVAVGLWDALFASVAYLILIPLLSILVSPLFLLAYLLDAPAILVPTVWQGVRRGEGLRALASLPSYFVLRTVNSVFLLCAFWKEWIAGQPLLVYEKGH